MGKMLAAFYEATKQQRCLVCGRFGVDVAHIKPLSKHQQENGLRPWTARSHKGARAFFAVPLCRECHEKVHKHGEDWLYQQIGGKHVAYAHALRTLADVVTEVDDEV